MRVPTDFVRDLAQLERVAKWASIGVLTVAADVAIFRLVYPLTNSVLVANAVSMGASTLFNYLAHHRWSFESNRDHRSAAWRFAAALLLGYIINSVVVKIALLAGATTALAKVLAVPIQAPINFVILNRWVFADPSTSTNAAFDAQT